MSEWQPIETMPLSVLEAINGTLILYEPEHGVFTGFYTQRGWMDDTEADHGCTDHYYQPTHWMPLPEPPTTTPSDPA